MNISLDMLAPTLPKIRIISMPKGGAPDHIKRCWIGVVIPCLYFDAQGDTELAAIGTGQQVPSYVSYAVPQVHALEALEEKSSEAVAWWRNAGFPQHNEALFMFSAESVEPLGDIPTQRELYAQFN